MYQKGATLLEIVVLVVALIVVTALVIPATFHTRCGSSRKTDCRNSLKQIGIYFSLYESKYKSYPTPGDTTWFAQLWNKDMASNGNLFRCSVRGKSGSGTHYQGITGPGTWQCEGEPVYSWTGSGLDLEHAPSGLPLACDEHQNHGDDMNVLSFEGRVDRIELGTPAAQDVLRLLRPTNAGWAAPAELK